MSNWRNYLRGINVDSAFRDNRTAYRMPKRLNLTLLPYAILGVDGLVIAVRKYPPIKPKDLHSSMVRCPDKCKPGWTYRNGEFSQP